MLISLIAIGVLAQDYKMQVVPIRNVDARFLYEKVKPHLQNVAVVADPEKNTLTITGLKDSISEATRMIELFDVRSKPVELSIEIESIRFKWKQSSRVWTPNNGQWTFNHEITNTQFTVSPRINEDGSTTIDLSSFDDQKSVGRYRVRIEPDQSATSLIGGKLSWVMHVPPSDSTNRDGRTLVTVSVKGFGKN